MTTTINASTSNGSSMCVYWIHRKEHNDILSQGYVGITKEGRIKRRFWEHKTLSTNRHLKSALNKYDDIVSEVILIASEDYCKDIEFKLRNKESIGWNIAIGGSLPPSFKGKKRSQEFVEKAKLRRDSDETKKKKSLSALGNKRCVGVVKTEEQRKAISSWMKGRQNALGKQNGLKYRYIGTNILTGETITLIGGKPVKDAGFHCGHVSECANGSIKTHKGYTWKKELIHGKHN